MSDRGMKKFNPFKSLMGQDELIKEEKIKQQREFNTKPELSEYQKENIAYNLSRIIESTFIIIQYYNDGEILEEKGTCTLKNNFILINDKKIKINDIIDLNIINL